jgi:spore coat polysaccharide biosynthesis protein SpsF
MILAILQVGMASPRLPCKALALLSGQPMVWRQIERLRRAHSLDKIMVATSNQPVDDPLAAYLVAQGQVVFRGSAENLGRRFARCVEAAGPVSHVVRVKGDCPFIDAGLIDEAVGAALISGADYVSNRVERSYPRGLEVEVVTTDALARSARQDDEATAGGSSPMAEIRNRPERYSQAHLLAPRDVSHLDWRVKRYPDLAFARGVYDALHLADPGFGMVDVLNLLHGRQDLRRWAA